MIKMVAMDVDGTLMNSKNQVSQQTVQIINDFQNRGIKFVICTGRPTSGVVDLLEKLSLNKPDDHVISYNGALVQEVVSKKVLYEEALNYQDLVVLERLAREIGIAVHVQSEIGVLTPNQVISPYTIFDGKLNRVNVYQMTLEEIAKHSIYKIMLVGSSDEIDQIKDQIPVKIQAKYQFVRSLDCFIEFLHPMAGKGNALKALAESIGFSPDEIASVGDNENDISMFKYAAVGIAMGNASPQAKAWADYITLSNDDEGVYNALVKMNSKLLTI